MGDDREGLVRPLGDGEDTDVAWRPGLCVLRGSQRRRPRAHRSPLDGPGTSAWRAMMRTTLRIAQMELTAISRLWWIRLFAAAYALMTFAMAQTASVAGEADAGETFARLTVALLPLALMLVPLAAMLVGVSSVLCEQEAGGFLLAQPVTTSQMLMGRWLGQAGALCAAIAGGFGAGGLIVWANTGAADGLRFLLLVGACSLLALACLSVATLVAVIASSRGAAIGVVTFVWFLVVILYDAVALTGALWLTGRAGARLLFWSVFANVVDLVRIFTLTLAGTPHILGSAGESWVRTLGGPVPVVILTVAAMVAWVGAPLVIAAHFLRTRDL